MEKVYFVDIDNVGYSALYGILPMKKAYDCVAYRIIGTNNDSLIPIDVLNQDKEAYWHFIRAPYTYISNEKGLFFAEEVTRQIKYCSCSMRIISKDSSLDHIVLFYLNRGFDIRRYESIEDEKKMEEPRINYDYDMLEDELKSFYVPKIDNDTESILRNEFVPEQMNLSENETDKSQNGSNFDGGKFSGGVELFKLYQKECREMLSEFENESQIQDGNNENEEEENSDLINALEMTLTDSSKAREDIESSEVFGEDDSFLKIEEDSISELNDFAKIVKNLVPREICGYEKIRELSDLILSANKVGDVSNGIYKIFPGTDGLYMYDCISEFLHEYINLKQKYVSQNGILEVISVPQPRQTAKYNDIRKHLPWNKQNSENVKAIQEIIKSNENVLDMIASIDKLVDFDYARERRKMSNYLKSLNIPFFPKEVENTIREYLKEENGDYQYQKIEEGEIPF